LADLLIRRTVKIGGTLTDADSPPVLRDPTAAFGMRRADTLAIIVAAGTALTKVSTGVYELTVEDLIAGVNYTYWIETTINGQPTRVEKSYTPPAATTLPSYLTVAAADALAATLPGLAAYKALTDDAAKLAVLSMATLRLDNSRWQGRKYDPDQELEFPRVPYGDTRVWDWDATAEEAVVPQAVKVAVMFEADWIQSGTADRVQQALSAGLTSQSTGNLSETYNAALAARVAAGEPLPLCAEAERMMARYRLKSGGIR
jgi:hypothetical protein